VAGKSHYYYVKAILSDGREVDSEVIKNTCIQPAQKFQITTSNNAAGKPTLSWEQIDGATEYRVYRAAAKNGTYARVFTTKGKSYTHTSAVAGKTYYYYVKAVKGDGTAADSEIVTNTCLETAVFTVTTGHNAAGKPTLKWTAAANAARYEVYRATSENGSYVKVFTTTGKSYTHTSAAAGKTYYYKVKIVAKDGTSKFSAVVKNSCLIPEVQFSITTGHNAAGKPTMKWTAIPGAERYEVYRATSENGNYVKAFSTKGTSYTNSSAQAGKTYYYKLKVYLSNGTEKTSDVVVNSCLIPEAQFSIETGHNAAGKPTMKWTAIPGADHYEVYRSTSLNGGYVKVFTTKGTSYTHTSAQTGKIYYYKLKVCLTDGTSKTSDAIPNTCQTEEMVWIPKTGSKYHSTAECSNMNNPAEVTKSEAIRKGYTACTVCY
jgi:fibronectin type 3 domain-containing protein